MRSSDSKTIEIAQDPSFRDEEDTCVSHSLSLLIAKLVAAVEVSHTSHKKNGSLIHMFVCIQELPQEQQEILQSEPEYNQGQRAALAKLFFSGLHDIRHFNPSDSAVQIPIKGIQSKQKPTFESMLVGNDGTDQPTIRIRDLTMLR